MAKPNLKNKRFNLISTLGLGALLMYVSRSTDGAAAPRSSARQHDPLRAQDGGSHRYDRSRS